MENIQNLSLFGSLHKAWKPREYLSLQAGELRGDVQAALPTELKHRPLYRPLSCSALLSLAERGTGPDSTSLHSDTGMCSHTAHTSQFHLRNACKHLHCITDRLRGLSVVCLVHTDFQTHSDFFDFQGKFIRTNLICFFPLTTKGAKSFYKMFLSFIT